ncbi:MAG: hypothetical protein QXR87_06605 [Candidatus Hadarchaeales archaeon]
MRGLRDKIVWFRDPRGLEYLRVGQITKGSRTIPNPGRTYFGNQEAVYGCRLVKRMGIGTFLFEIFWLKTYDRGASGGDRGPYAGGEMPVEAVPVEELLRRPGVFLREVEEPEVPRCSICTRRMRFSSRLKAYVCKNWKCPAYWKLGTGPILRITERGLVPGYSEGYRIVEGEVGR